MQALEAAFINEDVINGDQIVFARIRIRIDNLIEGEEYRVTFPYGIHTFVAGEDAGPGTRAGPGLRLTRDIGITTALDFAAPLEGDIGPFLIPTSDTGGPFGANFFRVEGPDAADPYPLSQRCADPTLGPDPVALNDCMQGDRFFVGVCDRQGE